MKRIFPGLALLLAACVASPAAHQQTPPPRIAHHQHLISPAFAQIVKQPVMDGAALVALLDAAGIERGVVLSMGYTFADERKRIPGPDAAVRAENDWTASQVARSRGRLIGFCSVNPLREAAIAEVDRCTRLANMRGLKLHFGNSGVSLRDPAHAARLAEVFAAANARRAPVIVHMRSRTGTAYGREDAELFLDRLMPAAPDIVVQIAHLAGSGGFPEDAEQAMNLFAEAIARGDPRTRNLYFDATTVVVPQSTAKDAEFVAKAIRAVGVERIVFGSDLPISGNPSPVEGWALFRAKVPLTDAEFRTIALNTAPYARRR